MLRLNLLAEQLVEILYSSGLITDRHYIGDVRSQYNPPHYLYLTRVTPPTSDWAPALAFLALLDTTRARDFMILALKLYSGDCIAIQ